MTPPSVAHVATGGGVITYVCFLSPVPHSYQAQIPTGMFNTASVEILSTEVEWNNPKTLLNDIPSYYVFTVGRGLRPHKHIHTHIMTLDHQLDNL